MLMMLVPKWYFTLCFIAWLAVACSKGSSDTSPPPNSPPDDTTATPPSATFANPLLLSGPDPWVVQQNGFYYYTHTLGNCIALWKTEHIEDLRNAAITTVWQPVAGTSYSTDIWAPELHRQGDKWYIYYAADSSGINSTHRMFVLENSSGDPTKGTWTLKGKLTDRTDKWAIDASVFTYEGNDYVVWSGWQGNIDGEQDIFIAKLANAYTIEGDRVLLSRPEYSWETAITYGINVTVNEGPEAIVNPQGQLFLTYSAGGCWSDDYALGLLTLSKGGNPLNPADWTKTPEPVFTKNPSGGAYGPGHNGFFTSPDGTENWIIYHANNNKGEGCGDSRNPRIQKFSWRADGTPDFGKPVGIGVKLNKPSGQ